MADSFRLTLCQLNPALGAIGANADAAFAAWRAGRDAGADMVALPEMFVTGSPPDDLGAKPAFHSHAMDTVRALALRVADGPALGIGGPWARDGRLYNAYLVLKGGRIASTVLKHVLRCETGIDEGRVFDAGPIGGPYPVGDIRIGSPIGADAWGEDVAETLAETGAEFLLVPGASPYRRGGFDTRMTYMVSRVVETGLPLVCLNMVGGQDAQVFDGASFALNPGGALAMQMPPFEEDIAHLDLTRGDDGWRIEPRTLAHLPDDWEQDYRAMVVSLADHVRKSGFSRALLELSGGADSALVAAVAADALGPQNLRCVLFPSGDMSGALSDAEAVARALGCRCDTVPISGARAAVTGALAPIFAGTAPDVTAEDIGPWLHGLLLTALSTTSGEMLLAAGNKSRIAVGDAAEHGDMVGGFNPLKDLYRTRVLETCRWRNANHRPWMKAPAGEMIPPRLIDRALSAEPPADRKDEGSLPPQADLDAILEMLIDGDASVAEVVARGYERDAVRKVENLVYRSKGNRARSAPGTRLTRRAFGPDRRYPVVHPWRDPS